MGSNIFRALGVAAAVAVLGLTGCGSSADSKGSGDPDTLVLASIPSENSGSLQQQYRLVADVIEKETGHKVQFQNATDYAGVIEGQRAGKVQIAGYGPFSYALAKDSGVQTTAIAAPVNAADAKPGYVSYAVTKPGSPIKTLADFRGKKVCFVDPSSTSGYLYPSAGLKEAGLDPEKDITPVFAGGHDASVLAVLSGQCDAGFAYDTIVDKTMPEKGQLKPGDIGVIWKSQTIPTSPIAISTTLSAPLQEKLTAIFRDQLNIPALTAAGRCSGADCTLPDGVKYGYVPVQDSLYDGVRQVCKVTDAKACKS
ncbi:phosphate/phosphite/phosphonate ABC transporter substrate-binding protein [Nocardia mexicana]|uniref:Phosphonate transport system substrate-binding protein n=1 Tax=Nocardia mexicana TaxID=279262 RepID=A0A370HE97_9NOCA|nr:phosphate/phosphite/phosphonate ABC transporter substrate-binding protein [Nocardia mexicana]RDI55355.1 phosphonate transport system substrate-binding protein [Nocardia mexicana]